MNHMPNILLQCDFDGTVTDKDVSFFLLDTFGDSNWHQLFRDYQEGKITVGQFNREAFATVKVSRQELLDAIRGRFHLRPGFKEMLGLCERKGYRLVIVSNGLDFYVDDFLQNEGLSDIEFHAAKTEFGTHGLNVQYIAPDGTAIDKGFKDSYVSLFLKEGYRVTYIGDGGSDFGPAKRCQHIFARESLLSHCQQSGVLCTPFNDFNDIVRVMRTW
jgi:2-hydroxy-3-keto-5-methylthiopentenyl-1-phosphate phosphatase